MNGSSLDLVHTEVPAAYRGQGLAAKLANTALEWARAQCFKVTPSGSYIGGYIDNIRSMPNCCDAGFACGPAASF